MAKDTKERILTAALEMFSQKGYDGTNIRELSASLGMGKSSMYRHFESKEDIWDALLDEMERKTTFSESYPTNQYVNVLLYHQIDQPGRNLWNTIVSPEHFEAHIRFLADTYPVLRFEDDWSKAVEPSVVLTFDDGYVDNWEKALPILQKYDVPATFFISTGYIDTGKPFWWDALDQIFHDSSEGTLVIDRESVPKGNVKKAHSLLRHMTPTQRDQVLSGLKSSICSKHRLSMRPMSVDELKKFSNSPLVTIGAHTVSHSSLQFESSELQAWEIGESRKMLESWLDRRIDLFSYPFGDCSAETVQLLKEKGFVKAGTVAAGLSGTGDPFRIPRNVVRDWPIEAFTKFMRRTWCLFAEMKN